MVNDVRLSIQMAAMIQDLNNMLHATEIREQGNGKMRWVWANMSQAAELARESMKQPGEMIIATPMIFAESLAALVKRGYEMMADLQHAIQEDKNAQEG